MVWLIRCSFVQLAEGDFSLPPPSGLAVAGPSLPRLGRTMAQLFIEKMGASFVLVGVALYFGHQSMQYVVDEVSNDLKQHLQVTQRQLTATKEQLSTVASQQKLLEGQLHLAHHRMDSMQEDINRLAAAASQRSPGNGRSKG